jgi:copper chaperone
MSSTQIVYSVPGVSCAHCRAAIVQEVSLVPGVVSVDVDLDWKIVTVVGTDLDDRSVRGAIDEAGYETAEAGT